MTRTLLIYLALFAPTLIYLGYVMVARQRALAQGREPRGWWQDAPKFWLAASGLVLLAVLLVGWALIGDVDRAADYVPPRLIDGTVVPGHFNDPPDP